ncbi:MAG: glycosyltransferase family 2 protein [Candidatus Omnitrophota bacterium]
MNISPIAFFAYNRPEHTQKSLESLAENKEFKESDLYVFIDGPKGKDDRENIERVKSIIYSRPWCKNLFVQENTEHKGCARQVIEGVSHLFQKSEQVIILEDDIVVSPHFLSYMNAALEKYASEQKVMSVTGYLYPIKKINTDSGFMRLFSSWGWGTWKRAWKLFQSDAGQLLERLSNQKMRHEFNCQGSFNYYRMLSRQTRGEIDSWAIRFYASIFLEGGLTLYPAQALVKNIGFDNSGTNTYKNKRYNTTLRDLPVENFPEMIEESEEMFLALVDYFRKNHNIFCKVYDRILYFMNKK